MAPKSLRDHDGPLQRTTISLVTGIPARLKRILSISGADDGSACGRAGPPVRSPRARPSLGPNLHANPGRYVTYVMIRPDYLRTTLALSMIIRARRSVQAVVCG